MNDIPWVEKYRPKNFNDIVLGKENEQIFNFIIENDKMCNLFFFGSQGTGKTTTAINLINRLNYDKTNIIHLNASDNRGIETIRNTITQFVTSKSLYNSNKKIVILDEVDYMTKIAQVYLKHLIEKLSGNVYFILICNYISRVEFSLRSLFLQINFYSLPINKIQNFLKYIVKNENLEVNEKQINNLINYYKTDIRSMINTLQITKNYNILNIKNSINEIIDIIEKKEVNDIENYIKELAFKFESTLKCIINLIIEFIFENTNDEVLFKIEKNLRLITYSSKNEKYTYMLLQKTIKLWKQYAQISFM